MNPARAPFVGPELAAEGDRQGRYLFARDLWRAAHIGSEPSRYLSRPELEGQMEQLLADGGPRLLRLLGSGGYGKSTLLRWFLARRCVPDHVPCALVDLDEPTDPVNATKYPWLLLLEIAHQLNGQMAGEPFERLLSDYGRYRPLLFPQPPVLAMAGSASTLGTRTGDVDAREVCSLFLDALRDAPAEPVVVVIDTFEEAMLRRPADAKVLVRCCGTSGRRITPGSSSPGGPTPPKLRSPRATSVRSSSCGFRRSPTCRAGRT